MILILNKTSKTWFFHKKIPSTHKVSMASLGHIYVQDLSIRSVGEGLLIFLNARIDFRARAGYKICIFFQRVVPLGYYGRNLHLLRAFAKKKKWIEMAASTKGYIEPRSILFRQCLGLKVSQVWKSKSQQLISLQSGRLSDRGNPPFLSGII